MTGMLENVGNTFLCAIMLTRPPQGAIKPRWHAASRE